MKFSPTMPVMHSRMIRSALLLMTIVAPTAVAAQQAPAAKNARILVVPRRMVSGDRATLAVLDVNGRLTPGAKIAFSNGDHVTTDATGRGLFVAPLTPGILFATIVGRPGRIPTQVVAASAGKTTETKIFAAPHFASLSDRFELQGSGFCGDADKNVVLVNGQAALVLAASSESLAILPPEEIEAGPADLTVACGKNQAGATHLTFLALALQADNSPMKPGQKRTLTVHISGSQEKVALEAHNLAPAIAELEGGNPAKATSSGGPQNVAVFPLIGKQNGNILVSIRLLPGAVRTEP